MKIIPLSEKTKNQSLIHLTQHITLNKTLTSQFFNENILMMSKYSTHHTPFFNQNNVFI